MHSPLLDPRETADRRLRAELDAWFETIAEPFEVVCNRSIELGLLLVACASHVPQDVAQNAFALLIRLAVEPLGERAAFAGDALQELERPALVQSPWHQFAQLGRQLTHCQNYLSFVHGNLTVESRHPSRCAAGAVENNLSGAVGIVSDPRGKTLRISQLQVIRRLL
jgi:hypothetical protein